MKKLNSAHHLKRIRSFLALLLIMGLMLETASEMVRAEGNSDTQVSEFKEKAAVSDITGSGEKEPPAVSDTTDNVGEDPLSKSDTVGEDPPSDSDTVGEGMPSDPATVGEDTSSEPDVVGSGEEKVDVIYDPQPVTMEEIRAIIEEYETAYLEILEAEGFLAALEVQKPHWQYEVAPVLMPDGYNCQLVDWDEDFGAEYYTFFPNPVALADPPPTYAGNYKVAPPEGSDITDVFNIISGYVDSNYNNVAVITEDASNKYGAMWAKEQLDLSLPLQTEMSLHLGRAGNYQNTNIADGMTFTMHNDSKGLNAIGGLGEGLGVYKGRKSTGGSSTVVDGTYLRNSLVIEFDTYKNSILEDAFVDDPGPAHCALLIPRADIIYSYDHLNVSYFNAVQDWIKFKVTWTPSYTGGVLGGTLTYTFNGIPQSYTIADVNSVFGGTKVYWGFTGTTGGYTSLQAAAITKLPDQEYHVEKMVENGLGEAIDDGIAKAGETINYKIRVESPAAFASMGVGPVIVKDQLSDFLDPETISDITMTTGTSSGTVGSSTVSDEQVTLSGSALTVKTGHTLGDVGDWLEISFSVMIKDNAAAGSVIENTAVASATGLDDRNSNTTKVTVASNKIVDSGSEAGVDGAAVKAGDEITYQIGYINPTGKKADLTITDNLPVGVEYVSHTGDGGTYDETGNKVVWKIDGVAADGIGYVTLTVRVTAEAVSTIKNTANLSWDTGSGNPDTEDPEVTNPVASWKTVDSSSEAGVNGTSVKEGDKITYRIGYINPTGKTADLTITDNLPAGVKYVSHTGGGTYDKTGNKVVWKIDGVAAGGTGYVTLTVRVTAEAESIIKNIANLSWDTGSGDPVTEAPEVTNPLASKKTVDSGSKAGVDGEAVKAGDEITYRISYINPTSETADLTITDKLPAGVEYISHTGSGTYNKTDNKVVWKITGVTAEGTGYVTLTVKVTAEAGSTIKNIANMSWDTGSGDPVTEDPEVTNPVASWKIVDGSSEAGVDGAAVKAGDEITYRIGYVNPTGETADLTITDKLPAGVEYVSHTGGGMYNKTDNKVVWTIDGVIAGGTGYVTLTVRVTAEAGAAIKNIANLSWDTGSGNPETEDPEVTNPVASWKIVDGSSEAGADGAAVKAGDEITYRIGYVNPTGKTADLTITDKLPAGVEYVSHTDGGTYNKADNKVVWKIDGVAAEGTGYVTLTVRVTEKAGTTIKNIANMSWDTGSGDPDTEDPEVTNPVVSWKIVDSSSEAGADGAAVKAGDEITYRIGYVNPTGETADLTITDKLPTGVEYVSHTGGGTYNKTDNKVVWTIDGVAADGTGYVTLTVRVTAGTGTVIKNIGNLSWDTGSGDPDTEDPEVINPVASWKLVDGSSEAGADGAAVKAGDEITYRIGYVNPTGKTADLTITDKLPAGVEYVSHTDGGTYNKTDNKVVWTIDGVIAGGTGYVTLTVRVTAEAGAAVKNIANLSWDTGSGNPETEDPEVTNPVASWKIVDGSSEAGADGAAVKAGDEITYRIGYVNPTGRTADLTITDELPTGMEYISHTGGGTYNKTDNKVVWKIDGVAADGTGYVTLTVKVTAEAESTIKNIANLSWDTGSGDPDTEDPEVTNPVASWKIVDSGSEAGMDGASVKAGDEITYRIGYVNPTGKTADLTITDKLPAGVEYVSHTDGGTYNKADNKVVWKIDGVAAEGTGYVTLTVRVTEKAGTAIKNIANLSWDTGSGDPDTEDPEVTNPVVSWKIVDSSSEAGADGAAVKAGDEITYRIGYVNPTGKTADLTITDKLPSGVEYVSHTGGGTYNKTDNKVVWAIDSVIAGGTGYVTLTVRVTAEAGAAIKNIANLSWDTGSGNPETEDPEVTNPVASWKIVDGSSEAGADGAAVKAGDEITYRIGYVNPTGKTADLTITDKLPAGMEYVSHTGGGTYNKTDNKVVWKIDGVAADGTGYVTLTVKVTAEAESTIKNTAHLSWDTGSGDPETEDPEVTNPVASWKIVDSSSEAGVGGAAVKAGDEITYRIGYVNPTGKTADLTITDKLPTGVEYVSHTGGGVYSETDNEVVWKIEDVAADGTGYVTLTVRVTTKAGSTIKNTANLSWDTGSGDPETEDPEVTNPVASWKIVDDSSEAGADGAAVKAGDEITYRIGYVNPTGKTADLTITDKLPAGVEYVSHTGGGVYNKTDNKVVWAIDGVIAGGTGYVTLTVRVTAEAGAAIKNIANLSWDTGFGDPETEDPEVTNPVVSWKIVDGNSQTGVDGAVVKAGDEITYRIGYVNPTGETADLTITDKLPEGVRYVSHTGGGTYNKTDNQVVWIIEDVAADGTGYVTLTVRVTTKAGSIIKNTANLFWDTGSGDPETEDPEVINPIASWKLVDGSSEAGADDAAVKAGDEITYQIGYVNPTGKTADLTITDKLPTGVEYVSHTGGGVYNKTDNKVVWKIDDVAADGTDYVTLTVRVTAEAGSTIKNTANLSWDTGSGDPVTEDPEVTNPVVSWKIVDSSSEAGADGAAVKAGDEITYRIGYVNPTGKTADLTITDKLPAGVEYVSHTGGGTYDKTDNQVVWKIDGVIAGGTGYVTLTVRVTAEAGAAIKNIANLSWDTGSGDPITEDPEVTNPVASWKIVDSSSETGADGAAVKAGDEITYRIGYVNPTGETADLTITDKLPEGVEYVSHTGGGTYNKTDNQVVWIIEDVAADGTGYVTLTVRVTTKAGSIIKNTANLFWDTGSGNPDTEDPEVTNPVVSWKVVDSSSEAGADGAAVKAGDEITYRIGYVNLTGKTADLTITDKLPAGVEYVSHTGGGVYNKTDNKVVWTIDGVIAGGTGYVTLTVRVTAEAGAAVRNIANLSWDTGSGDPVTEDPEVTNPVVSWKIVDSSSEAGADGAAVKAGDEITYRIGYVNPTGKTADLTITDKLPEGVEYVSHTGGGTYDKTDNQVVWTIDGVIAGGTGYVTLTVKVTAEAGAAIKNIANLSWDTGSGDPVTEDPEVTNPVASWKIVDSSSEAGADGAAVKAGDEITYRIGYVNPTGETADLTITDKLPMGVEYVSHTGGGTYNKTDNQVVWKIDDVAADGTGYVTLTIRVTAEAESTIRNTANLSWDTGSGDPDTEDPEVTNPVASWKIVDGSSEAGADGEAVKAGDEITYRIGYVNPTGKTADLTITDKLPAGVEYVSHTGGGTYNKTDNKVVWTIDDVIVGGTGYVTLTVKVTAEAGTIIKNIAHLTWDTGSGNPETEDPEVTNPVASWKIVDGSSQTGVDGGSVKAGDEITYRIGYVNPTGKTANLTITDKLPTGVEYVSHTGHGAYDKTENKVVWTIDGVAADGTGYVTLTVKVTAEAGTIIKNIANLSWDTGSGEPETEDPEVTNPVVSWKIVDSSSEAGAAGAAVKAGDEITYRIGYVNPTDKTADLTITDKLPAGVEYVSHTGGGTYNKTDNKVVWTINGVIAGGTGYVTLTVRVTADVGAAIKNIANLSWDTGSGNPETEDPEVTNPVASWKLVDGSSEAGVDGTAVKAGDEITYRIGYVNPTGKTADLTITDKLPAGVEYVSQTGGGTYNKTDNKVVWKIDGVAAEGTGYVTLTVKVTAEAESTIKNIANLSWDTGSGNPETEDPEVTNPVASWKLVDSSSEAGADGAAVKAGDEITYRIGYVNPTGKTANLTITDKLPTGVEYVSHTDGGAYDETDNKVVWKIDDVVADGTGYVTLTVRVTAEAGAAIKNIAHLSWDTGSGNPETEDPEVTNPVISWKIVDSSSEAGADGAAVKAGDEITYRIGYVNPTGKTADLTITDKLPAGVEYVSQTGGGAYDKTGNKIVWTIDGVAADGIGYVTLTVRVTAEAESTIRNTANLSWDTGSGNPETEDPEVINPVASWKIVDTDSKAGADGAAVKAGDEITYRIGYVNPTGKTANLTITDKLPMGVEYISHTGSGRYDKTDNKVVWTIDGVAADGTGYVTLTVRVTEEAGTAIKNIANLSWDTGSGDPVTEDPEVTNPVASWKIVDSSSETGVDGATVKAGDEITYRIGYVNPTGKTADLTITDKLPTGVEYVSHTDGGTYDEKGSKVIWKIDGVAADGTGYVTLTVRVTTEAGTAIKNIANLSWDTGSGDPVTEDPETTNLLASRKIVDGSSEAGVGGAAVKAGDEITYRIGYTNPTGETADLTITDKLPAGVEYVSHTDGGTYDKTGNKVVWTISDVVADGTGYVTLTVRVTEEAESTIKNIANLSWDTGSGDPVTEDPETTNPLVSRKTVDSSSKAGVNGAAVRAGDEITYRIGYTNPTGETADLIITDKLPTGVEYVSHTEDGTYDESDNMVVWTIDGVAAGGTGYVTLTVKVTAKAGRFIKNIANLFWYTDSGDLITENPEVTNPVSSGKVADANDGGKGKPGGDDKKGSAGNDGKKGTTGNGNIGKKGYGSANAPKTGDTSNAGFWIILLGGAVCLLWIIRRRKQHNKEC